MSLLKNDDQFTQEVPQILICLLMDERRVTEEEVNMNAVLLGFAVTLAIAQVSSGEPLILE